MNRTLQRSIAVGLACCLLLLSGLVYVQTVDHAVHHAHHQAATHASVLCSWMCAAGQSLEGITVAFYADLSPLALVDPPAVQDLLTTVLPSPVTRGPPFSV